MQSSASKKSESKIIDRLLAREASAENTEFKVTRALAQISSSKARIQSSEFAAGLGGQEKQSESKVQNCDPSFREFGDARTRIESSEFKMVHGSCRRRD